MVVTEVATDEARVLSLIDELFASADPSDKRQFHGRQFDLGLAWVHFPEGHGGLGLSPKLQRLVNDEIKSRGGPLPGPGLTIGLGMGAPTVVAHGSEEQKRRYLRPLFTGEEVWCQLFSEPGAGSDVAGLSSRAVRDGDEWVVNGQKVWTSGAHLSRWGMLVTRTDPNQPKHRGLSYFVLDMQAPGVEVRPLRQMTGQAEFNEVYLTDVRIPDSERLGDVGDGWRVALTTLMNERVAIGGTQPQRGEGTIAYAVEAWEGSDRKDPAMRDQLMRFWVEAEVNRLTNIRAAQNRRLGTPGPEGSIGKLAYAELNKRVMSFVMELMGPEAMLYGDYDAMEGYADPRAYFLRTRANSIEGGTSEIMRNILGERTLGLPGDVRVDKDVPWSEVDRG
ncbi:MAG: acyl-CoA dehydrogenase family protein [Actinomycetota bacterium]|nr:acyl-CoA dehydrogenase family protein [Actinomycetota bacterium]